MDANELTLLVSQFPIDTEAQQLATLFRQYGYVSFCKINTDHRNRSLGTAHVTFSPPPENLKWASLLNFRGQLLRIQPLPTSTADAAMTRNLPYARQQQANQGEKRQQSLKLKEAFEAQLLQVGIFKDPKLLSVAWETSQNVTLLWDFPARKLNIIFKAPSETEEEGRFSTYRFQCRFMEVKPPGLVTSIENEFWGTRETSLTLTLKRPPKLFRYHGSAGTVDPFEWSEEDAWLRIIQIHALGCDFGYMLTYRFRFDLKPEDVSGQLKLHRMLCCIADYNFISHPISFSTFAIEKYAYNHSIIYEHAHELDFDVLFKLESLVSYDILAYCNLDDSFFQLLKTIPPSTCLMILETFLSQQTRLFNPIQSLKDACERLSSANMMSSHLQRLIPSHCVLIRKVFITPTKMYCIGPIFEISNRVLRHFKEFSNDFLRVAFTDEGFIKVINNPDSYKMIHDRIKNVMKYGIQIGHRQYEFLAFSASQLREHSCWFLAKDAKVKAQDIRSWMGDFSSIKIVAKSAARMGQCFSSTRPVSIVHVRDMKEIPDVVRNGFTFSDGVGKMSPQLAGTIAVKLELETVPSAYQFRLGGYKGVLGVDPSMEGDEIAVRPSQKKFESKHRELEIIRGALYAPCYLNRQVITLLTVLGVRDEVFLRLKDQMIHRLNSMLRDSTSAVNYLRANCDGYGVTQFMMDMIEAGMLEQREPFLMHCLRQFRASQLRELKLRTRILVSKGATLMGVMDEASCLEPNQVFIQYHHPERMGKKEIMKGLVVVTRNPAFHPGDIRVLQAVDIPALHHWVDVIVFSSKGDRDVPSMCSGGDLDGDLYIILQEKALIPELHNYQPMDHPSPKPLQVDSVSIEDIKNFFTDYIINDNLGIIAHSHMAHADAQPDGAFNPLCLRLAALHSQAVDFPKSGVPAKMTRNLKVLSYPDFMEKRDRPSYRSPNVLGHIYRSVQYTASHFPLADLYPHPSFRYPGFENYLNDALEVKQHYDVDLATVMNYHGVYSEVEAITGYFLRRYHHRKQQFDTRHSLLEAFRSIRKHYRDEFMKEFNQALNEIRQKMDDAIRALEIQHLQPKTSPSGTPASSPSSSPSSSKSSSSFQLSTQVEMIRKDYEKQLEHLKSLQHQSKMAKASAWYFVTYHPHFFKSHMYTPPPPPPPPNNEGSNPNFEEDDEDSFDRDVAQEDSEEGFYASSKRPYTHHQAMPLISFPWTLHDILCQVAKHNSAQPLGSSLKVQSLHSPPVNGTDVA